jgi:hypothetical protein
LKIACATVNAIGVVPQQFTTPENTPLTISQSQLLAGDSDGNFALQAGSPMQPAHATLVANADGSFTYSLGPTFQGIDRFSFQASENGVAGNIVTDTILSYHASLVDKLYKQVLHRSAEDQGLVFWTSQLDAGQKLDLVAKGIFNSVERLNPLVTQFYQQFLNRGTDPQGLAFWVADWQTKGDPRDVVENILASKEFLDDAGDTNAGFITLLYQRVLNRPAEPSGLDYWVGLMGPPNASRMSVRICRRSGTLILDPSFRCVGIRVTTSMQLVRGLGPPLDIVK